VTCHSVTSKSLFFVSLSSPADLAITHALASIVSLVQQRWCLHDANLAGACSFSYSLVIGIGGSGFLDPWHGSADFLCPSAAIMCED